nr:MAG TPA: hypothetical protein [Caudoviricetes sp.]
MLAVCVVACVMRTRWLGRRDESVIGRPDGSEKVEFETT